jgi:hypothetical protein
MHGAIPPLPNMPPWRGAQLKIKHRDYFTLTFMPTIIRVINEGGWSG